MTEGEEVELTQTCSQKTGPAIHSLKSSLEIPARKLKPQTALKVAGNLKPNSAHPANRNQPNNLRFINNPA